MDFAIVGGGISGLSLAYFLAARGKKVQLFEADQRLGGTVHSFRQGGYLLEGGPNALLDREPHTARLLQALGLKPKLAEPSARRRYVCHRGRLIAAPSSPPAFLRTPLLSPQGRLRALAEVFTPRLRDQKDESLGDFGRRHVGAEATRVILDAVQTGTYAGDLERLSAKAAFPALAELERDHRSLLLGASRQTRGAKGTGAVYTLEGGLGALIDALRAQLAGAVQTGTRAVGLQRKPNGWRLSVSSASGEAQFEAAQVVLATPAPPAAALIRPLDAALAATLEEIPYVGVAVVHLGFAREALEALPAGFGYIAPAAERRAVLGALFISSVFPWRSPEGAALFTCMLGGAHRPEQLALDDDALVAVTSAELGALLGVSAAPTLRKVIRWPQGIPQYEVGHQARLLRIDAALARLPGLTLTGNAFRGVGFNDCVRNSAELAARLAEGR